MLFTHVSNFVHKSPKMTKLFRRFREEIAPVWVKIVVVFGQSIFIRSLVHQLSSLVLEIFFEWVVILKFLILFCVWSIYVFSAPFLKKVYLKKSGTLIISTSSGQTWNLWENFRLILVCMLYPQTPFWDFAKI